MARAPAVLLCASALAATAVTAAPVTAATPQCRGGVLHPVGTRTTAYSAEARGRTTVYRRQDRGPLAVFPRLTWSRYPTTFWIVGAIVNKACAASWYRVKLPIRPNGVVGYVRPSDVDVARVTTSIAVDLSRRTLFFYRRGKLVLTTRVAVGSSATRTPIGRYFVSQRIRVSDADGPYGPAVLGVSAFSAMATGWARGGPIAIHGTNAPWSIGLAASNGCIRVPNATLMRLFAVIPAGTPVTIHPREVRVPLSSPAMAQRKQQQKDVLQRLADSGEEALQKFIGDLPGGSKVVGAMNSLLARVDELSKRMRSLDPLERRVAELERRLDALSKPKPAAKKATSTARRRKPAASSSSKSASS